MTISLCFYRVHVTADCNTWLILAPDNANNVREGDTYRVFSFWVSHYFKGGLRIFLHAPNTEWLLQTHSQCKPYRKSCRVKVRTMAATKYFPGGKLLERKIKRKKVRIITYNDDREGQRPRQSEEDNRQVTAPEPASQRWVTLHRTHACEKEEIAYFCVNWDPDL